MEVLTSLFDGIRSMRDRTYGAVRLMNAASSGIDIWSLRDRFYGAAREGRVDDVSQLSTYFTGDVVTLGGALGWACEYGQLNVVTWLVKEHTVLRNAGSTVGTYTGGRL
jgi:hypothetical protein